MTKRVKNSMNNIRMEEALYSRRSRVQDSDTESYLEYIEGIPKYYHSYEEFVNNKLEDYINGLNLFCKKVKEAERNLIGNYNFPTANLYKDRSHTKSINKHRAGTMNNSKAHRSPANTLSKVVLMKNSKNQKLIRLNKKYAAQAKSRFTPTSNQKSILKTHSKGSKLVIEESTLPKTNTKNYKRNIGVNVLIASMAKRRRELIGAERKMYKSYLKSNLNTVLGNINSTRDLFTRMQMSDHK